MNREKRTSNSSPAGKPYTPVLISKKESPPPTEFTENFVHLPIGEIVEVVHGPLAGIRSHLLEHRGHKLLVIGVQPGHQC